MEYKKAQEIRNKGLLSLIAENKFKRDMGLGASIGSAISDKFKAKSVGIKEKFDPLNIVRAITGNGTFGNIATTIAGRALGKSEKDISYFGGYGRRLKQHQGMTKIGQLGQYDGGSTSQSQSPLAGILGNMYQFMQKTYEVDKKDYEIQQAFLEEQNSDAETRHKQLVRAIKRYVKVPSTPSEQKESGGMFDSILNMFNELKNKIDEMLKPITDAMKTLGKNVLKSLLSFGGFLISNPAVTSALMWLVGIPAAKEFLDKTDYGNRVSKEKEAKLAQNAFKNMNTDFSHMPLDKEQAKAILELPETPGKKKDIAAFGGLERIQAIAEGKPDPGGVSLQKPIDINTPTNQTKEFQERKSKVNSSTPSTEMNKNQVGVVTPPLNSTPTPQVIPSSANINIPTQLTPESSSSSSGQPVVVATNTTNNIGGGPAQSYNMNPISVRNTDLYKFLRNAAVPV